MGGRTDVEGCCWWGRGSIQTTGICNYGKLNFYMGKRAADEGRAAIFPEIDFCKNPEMICDPSGPPQLKWVTGIYYWLNSVQSYDNRGWNYLEQLKQWVENGMNLEDDWGFLDGASGIVNRGCHDPPACGTGELHGRETRRGLASTRRGSCAFLPAWPPLVGIVGPLLDAQCSSVSRGCSLVRGQVPPTPCQSAGGGGG